MSMHFLCHHMRFSSYHIFHLLIANWVMREAVYTALHLIVECKICSEQNILISIGSLPHLHEYQKLAKTKTLNTTVVVQLVSQKLLCSSFAFSDCTENPADVMSSSTSFSIQSAQGPPIRHASFIRLPLTLEKIGGDFAAFSS